MTLGQDSKISKLHDWKIFILPDIDKAQFLDVGRKGRD